MELDYKTLTMKQMTDYIKEKHNTKASKAAFAAAAVKEHKEECYVDVLDEDGNKIWYTDKNGKDKIRKKRVVKADGKVVKTKSVLDAKKYFYETYKDEIDFKNAPKEKKVDKDLEELLSWL